ncbi:M10 family metallopeptidase C-terminal domain-containing protein, partial [Synechococcus lacustris C3-12m-Tous]|uniref:bluetail domain-containing putative surface protein n=1 Tax=Synechococcus lacustris TaxID=2116544 RepID=UPI0020CB9D4E
GNYPTYDPPYTSGNWWLGKQLTFDRSIGEDYGLINAPSGNWNDLPNNHRDGSVGIAEIKLAPNNTPTGTPTVTGTLKVGSTLTIDTTAIKDSDNFTGYTPTLKYNWETSTDGTTWSKLTTTDGADNNNTYILTAAEASKKIRGVVSYLDGYGTNEVINSAMSVAIETVTPILSTSIIPAGSSWEYMFADQGVPESNWKLSYGGWKTGNAPFSSETIVTDENSKDWIAQTFWKPGIQGNNNEQLWVRKKVDLSGYDLSKIQFYTGVDNGLKLYVNGTQIFEESSHGFASRWEYARTIPESALKNGDNIFAIALNDDGGHTAFDFFLTSDPNSSLPLATIFTTYTLTPSAASINEGAVLTSTVATTNVATGTKFYYALSGTGITTADFSAGALTGEGVTDATGKFSFSHTLANDLTTEGAESLEIKLYSDSARSIQLGSTASVSIADTSNKTPTYTITPSATTINEGSRLTTTVTTTGVDRLSKLYYSLSGTGITTADFAAGALTGEGTTDSWGKFNFSHILAKDLLTEGTESISIKLYSDSDRTLQVGSTATVLIEDTSVQIEFTGTINNDVLVGNSANNTIKGLEGADTLTGSEGVDKFVYALADSRLAAYDHITDFAIGTDLIDAPIALSSANLRELGAVSALTQADIAAVLTTATFVRNGAATFSFGTGSSTKTFLALNDGIAGYSSTADGLIEITGFTGALTNLALI